MYPGCTPLCTPVTPASSAARAASPSNAAFEATTKLASSPSAAIAIVVRPAKPPGSKTRPSRAALTAAWAPENAMAPSPGSSLKVSPSVVAGVRLP